MSDDLREKWQDANDAGDPYTAWELGELMLDRIEALEAELQLYIKADHDGAASLAVDLAEQQQVNSDLKAEKARLSRALKLHHDWQQNIGTVKLGDDDVGWHEVDMSDAYTDSTMCDLTVAALTASSGEPSVNRSTQYPHSYPGSPVKNDGDCWTSDCTHGCGAWAGPAGSGAPDGIDPFGECPRHPNRSKLSAAGEAEHLAPGECIHCHMVNEHQPGCPGERHES